MFGHSSPSASTSSSRLHGPQRPLDRPGEVERPDDDRQIGEAAPRLVEPGVGGAGDDALPIRMALAKAGDDLPRAGGPRRRRRRGTTRAALRRAAASAAPKKRDASPRDSGRGASARYAKPRRRGEQGGQIRKIEWADHGFPPMVDSLRGPSKTASQTYCRLPSVAAHQSTAFTAGPDLLPHVAVLVLLAAAARARVVAADAVGGVADRLDLLRRFGRVRAHAVLAVGRGAEALGRAADTRSRPPASNSSSSSMRKTASVILSCDAVPHLVERLHALALVLGLRIDLRVADEADAGAQVVHRQQVLLPGVVEPLQQQAALQAAHLRPVAVVEGVPQHLPRLVLRHAGQRLGRDLDAVRLLEPLGDPGGVLGLRRLRALELLVELGVDLFLARRRIASPAEVVDDFLQAGSSAACGTPLRTVRTGSTLTSTRRSGE